MFKFILILGGIQFAMNIFLFACDTSDKARLSAMLGWCCAFSAYCALAMKLPLTEV